MSVPEQIHVPRGAVALLVLLCASIATATLGRDPYHVLFLISDDMNDWIGCLGGHPDAITPNLDRLAERGANRGLPMGLFPSPRAGDGVGSRL